MSIDERPTTQISIDLKRNRIRIHKGSLHSIGDPTFIQLLVNTQRKLVAIRSVEKQTPSNQAYKLSKAVMASDFSIELYSRLFIQTLISEFDCFQGNGLYRMSGTVFTREHAAIYSILSAQPYLGGTFDGKK